MKNTLADLNNHLFAQLERLNDEELVLDEIREETARAKSVVDVSNQIIEIARVSLQAQKLVAEVEGRSKVNLPPLLENK